MNLKVPQATRKGYIEIKPGGVFDWAYPTSSTRRGRVQNGGVFVRRLCVTVFCWFTKGMKKARLRLSNNVDLNCLFSAKIMGGVRGYDDALAVETFSNDIFPCVKCMVGFTIIVEVTDG